MIKVGVVAGSTALRIGLREVINNLPGLAVTAAAARQDELTGETPDVVVAAMPAGFEDAACARPTLYLADNPADFQDTAAAKQEAWGALPLNASEGELLAAIHALAEGLWVGAPSLVGRLLAPRPLVEAEPADPAFQPLTEREIEVLQFTAQGLANKQIAARLGISEHTVKFHLSSLYAKLGVSSRMEAVRVGARRGLVVL